MNFIQAIQSGFKNYVNFQGRASRSEYWWWILAYMIIYLPLYMCVLAGGNSPSAFGTFCDFLMIIFVLAVLLPSLAVGVRRLHDTGHSGWWLLVGLIPLVGLILLFWYCKPGDTGTNKYGSNPLGMSVVNTFE